MDAPVLQQEVLDLKEQVNQVLKTTVNIAFKEEKKGWLASDQAQMYLHDGQMQLDVYDVTAPNYTVSHELLHVLALAGQTPQINFQMTTGDQDRDTKIMTVGMELYDSVLHLEIYPKQAELGLLDEKIMELFYQGLLAQLTPEEAGKVDDWMVLRTVKLVDALVLFAGTQAEAEQELAKLYPQSMQAAQKLYQKLTEKPLNGPQKIRAAIVKLWRGFDEQLSQWGLAPLGLNDFISLEPVLSERQTRLNVAQLFEVYHSSLQDNLKFKSAYIVRYRSDRQNSFVLPEPDKNQEEIFRNFYAAPIGEILQQMHIEYLIR
ncbi:IpaB/EvcA family protein [Ligilactobacillus pabuli]|uniref:IpaB/EvcA family protein n=1 Tax=Ligilactobacillus pabuli TaxID=2886039 RepID=A0ABQ5JJ77_9LACO|nr:IpaB/EvcA family protein [Ligilactobacillus pabuli]GKS82122.1 IpaB/EvcA family protein [Ligilactobacillus pabuli]HIW88950.1 IpaB/EvcA family protein [Candidatus Ligilactobacillus excrementipullorum]